MQYSNKVIHTYITIKVWMILGLINDSDSKEQVALRDLMKEENWNR
jgi:hypothetical protein